MDPFLMNLKTSEEVLDYALTHETMVKFRCYKEASESLPPDTPNSIEWQVIVDSGVLAMLARFPDMAASIWKTWMEEAVSELLKVDDSPGTFYVAHELFTPGNERKGSA